MAFEFNRTLTSKSHSQSKLGKPKGANKGNTPLTEQSVGSHISSEEVELVAQNPNQSYVEDENPFLEVTLK